MSSSTTNHKFAQQISIDEYNKQKKEYTEKALQELKEQMATLNPNKDTSDSEDTSSDSDTADINVIINTYKNSTETNEKDTGLRRRRVHTKSNDEGATGLTNASLTNAIYLQREFDIQEIQKLKNQIKKLKNTLDDVELKNHFLKLDLCNAKIDNSELKKAIAVRDVMIKDSKKQLTYSVMVIFIVWMLNLWFVYAYVQ